MNDSAYAEISLRFRPASKGNHGSGASPDEIRDAQRVLGVVFPDSYKEFLSELGWGSVAHWELYGLGADVPSGLYLTDITLEERADLHPLTPVHLVPIMNNGFGDLYCLDTDRLLDGECPVVFWDHEMEEDQIPDDDAPGFLPWLSKQLDMA